MRNQSEFTDKYDTMLLVNVPAAPDRGEDSFYAAGPKENEGGKDRAVMGVFDGSGGLGARIHPEAGGHSEAWLGARILAGALHDWYHQAEAVRNHQAGANREGADMIRSLREYFCRAYAELTKRTKENTRVRGSMVRSFPSTAAIVLACDDPDGVYLHILWAGDSRVYLLNSGGLCPLTEDDLTVRDALVNLRSDDAMTNVISSDGDYSLHYRGFPVREPAMVLAATDGCFNYLPTPMEFEYELLSRLQEAGSPEEYADRLGDLFARTGGDDATLGILSFYFGTFNNQKKLLKNRLALVEKTYASPLASCRKNDPGAEAQLTDKLWKAYKEDYERLWLRE